MITQTDRQTALDAVTYMIESRDGEADALAEEILHWIGDNIRGGEISVDDLLDAEAWA